MEIKRDRYLNKLIAKKNNGLIKVITGIRRSGKSYLLFELYYKYLLSIGITENHIVPDFMSCHATDFFACR